MTPRQRVLAVLRGERPDKVPFTIYESMIPQCAVERKLRNDGLCIVHRRCPAWKEQNPGCTWESHRFEQEGRPRVRHLIRTPVGDLTSLSEPAETTSWTLEHLFKGPQDYRALCYLEEHRTYQADYEPLLRAERWMGQDIILRGGVGGMPLHHIMIHLMGVEVFAVEWAERRDEILKLEALLRRNLRQVYPIAAAAPVTHANFGGNEVPEVMGPPRYREFCIPLIDECAEIFHAHGKLLGSHMDGNNRPWAADLARCGLDYIEAFTPAPDTDMSIADALSAWPDKVLWINFPSSVHLADVETIRRTARQIGAAGRETGRVIIGITEDMPPDRWQQSLLTISEVINE
jgi:hypothetical protein